MTIRTVGELQDLLKDLPKDFSVHFRCDRDDLQVVEITKRRDSDGLRNVTVHMKKDST